MVDRKKIVEIQYSNYNIKPEILRDINYSTYIKEKPSPLTLAREPRKIYLAKALSFRKGKDQEHRIITQIHKIRNFSICVEKPGKEAAPNYKGARNYITGEKTNNENDMLPTILKDEIKYSKDLTFEEMFEKFEIMKTEDHLGLEILGTLLYRSAYMLDHTVDGNNISYSPDSYVINILVQRLPEIGGIPTDVILFYLDVLGLNEDVKVYTLGHTKFTSYGRVNTLLTFCNLISVILNRTSLAKFAGSFSRPPSGLAPITKKGAKEVYPLINENFSYYKLVSKGF